MSGFEQLGIQPWLHQQCAYMAIQEPTSIQKKCIPAILAGQHVVGGAATGSGKTAAFVLPILQVLSEDMYGIFSMVLTPSRELAYQIMDQFIALGAPLRIRTMLAIGGVRHEDQVNAVKERPHVIVATPGRLLHILQTFSQEMRQALGHLRFLVLDEADRLTEGDMSVTVREVLKELPAPSPKRQALLFSATLHPRLTTLASVDYSPDGLASDAMEQEPSTLCLLGVTDPKTVTVVSHSSDGGGDMGSGSDAANISSWSEHIGGKPMFPETLKQQYIFFPNMVKLPHLVTALRSFGKDQATIVFTNSCMRAELVRLTLQLLGFPVCSLNSLLTQQHRLDNLAMFKLGIARVLVATDIAARGLDIPNVGVVIHYDIPKYAPTYVHRVGRTARAQREGSSIAFVTEHDVDIVQRIEKKLGVNLTLWKERAMREANVLKVLDEVSAAKVQAKQQVTEQFGHRADTLKEHAAAKKADRARKHQRRVHGAAQQAPGRASEGGDADALSATLYHRDTPQNQSKKGGTTKPIEARKRARSLATVEVAEEIASKKKEAGVKTPLTKKTKSKRK